VLGHDAANAVVTTLGMERQFNSFMRLGNSQIIERLREKFADLPASPDAKTVFMKLRELRNSW
jgi:hydroxyacylglutathione hydrolase